MAGSLIRRLLSRTKYLRSQKYLHFHVLNTPTKYGIAFTAVYENDYTDPVYLRPWYFVIVLVSFLSAPFTHRDQGIVKVSLTAPDLSSVPENHRFHTSVQSLFTEYTALRPKPHGSRYGQIRMEYSFSPIPLPAKLIVKGGTTSNQVLWFGYLTRHRFLAPPNLFATCYPNIFFSS